MDFSVKDFNVRLRTIKLWEIIIAIVISFFLTLFVEGYFNISSGELEYILFFCFMMVFFLIATYGTTGFNKDVNDLFKASSILRVLILAVSNMFVAIFIQTMFFPLDSLLNMVNSISLPLLDVVTGTNDPLIFIFEMFSAIIIAPISEELFFRGVLFNRLKIIIYTCIMGMTLCILYSRTDNLLLNMLVHSAYNLLSYLLVYTPLQYLILGGEFSSLMGLILISSLIFIPVYILYFTYKLK